MAFGQQRFVWAGQTWISVAFLVSLRIKISGTGVLNYSSFGRPPLQAPFTRALQALLGRFTPSRACLLETVELAKVVGFFLWGSFGSVGILVELWVAVQIRQFSFQGASLKEFCSQVLNGSGRSAS